MIRTVYFVLVLSDYLPSTTMDSVSIISIISIGSDSSTSNDSSNSHSAPCWADLPTELWSRVLSFLDLAECMQCCALVCEKWSLAAAAAAATHGIQCTAAKQESLRQFVAKHEPALKALKIVSHHLAGEPVRLELMEQLINLTQLKLSCMQLTQPTSDTAPLTPKLL